MNSFLTGIAIFFTSSVLYSLAGGSYACAEDAEKPVNEPETNEKEVSKEQLPGFSKGGFTGELPEKITSEASHTSKTAKGELSQKPKSRTSPVYRIELSTVDQSIADLGPLTGSLRQMSQGMEFPSGFRKVYQVPDSVDPASNPNLGLPPAERRFMRGDGGLVAMFDRSVYIPTEDGLLPDIPASTIWVIGGIPLASEPGHGMLLPVDPLNPSQLPSGPGGLVPQPPSRASGSNAGYMTRSKLFWRAEGNGNDDIEQVQAPSTQNIRFIEDAQYRKQRLRTLLNARKR